MGLPNFKRIPGLVAAINKRDFNKAVKILKRQRWFRQVASRAPKVLKLLKDK